MGERKNKKHRQFTIEEKNEIVEIYLLGQTKGQRSLANDLGTGKSQIQTWVVRRTAVPQMYRDLRNWFRDHYGYQTGGTNSFEYGNVISHINGLYNTSLKTNHVLTWSFNGQVETEIDANRPTLWSQSPTAWTDDAKSYGNHAMVVKGYKVYSKTEGWWIFETTSYLKFMEMNDNWNSSNRYIDYDAYASIFGGGTFGTFLKVYK